MQHATTYKNNCVNPTLIYLQLTSKVSYYAEADL